MDTDLKDIAIVDQKVIPRQHYKDLLTGDTISPLSQIVHFMARVRLGYSVFSPNKISVPTVTIKVNDMKIKCVKECKYLRIIIDDNLKWTPHIDSVLQKLKRLLGIFYKMHYKLPDWCLRNIYFAFVHPYYMV